MESRGNHKHWRCQDLQLGRSCTLLRLYSPRSLRSRKGSPRCNPRLDRSCTRTATDILPQDSFRRLQLQLGRSRGCPLPCIPRFPIHRRFHLHPHRSSIHRHSSRTLQGIHKSRRRWSLKNRSCRPHRRCNQHKIRTHMHLEVGNRQTRHSCTLLQSNIRPQGMNHRPPWHWDQSLGS